MLAVRSAARARRAPPRAPAGGRLVAATNGAGHLAELAQLAGPAVGSGYRGFERFGLENGPGQLELFFVDVEVELYDDGLEVTEVEPLLAYLRSTIVLRPGEPELPRIECEVAAAIERDGSFHVTKSQGLVRGRRSFTSPGYSREVAIISRKNQVTVPVGEMRKAYLEPGDDVRVRAVGRRRLELVRSRDIVDEYAGIFTNEEYPPGYLEELRSEWDR